MNIEDPSTWFALLTAFVVFIVISYFFIRWIFAVDKQLKNQEMIIELLIKIANDEKVSQDQKDGIKNYVNR